MSNARATGPSRDRDRAKSPWRMVILRRAGQRRGDRKHSILPGASARAEKLASQGKRPSRLDLSTIGCETGTPMEVPMRVVRIAAVRPTLLVSAAVMAITIAVAACGGGKHGPTTIEGLKIDETINLTGLDGPVDVVRDEYGRPHVYATDLHDLATPRSGSGWRQQDRPSLQCGPACLWIAGHRAGGFAQRRTGQARLQRDG